MSTTNDTLKLVTLDDQRDDHGALADSVLDAVTGGSDFVITKLTDTSITGDGGVGGGGGSAGPAISAWNTLLKNYGYIR